MRALAAHTVAGFDVTTLPRSIRTNNPGAMNYGPFAQAAGAVGSDGRLAIFPDMETGYKAHEKLLGVYADKHGLNTIGGIVNRWAPPNVDNNSTGQYIQFVANKLGVSPDTPLSPDMRPKLAEVMAAYEAGRPVPRNGLSAAQPVASPSRSPSPGAAPMALSDSAPQGFSLDNWMMSPLFQMGAGVLGSPTIGQGLMQGSQNAAQMRQAQLAQQQAQIKQQRDAELFPLQKQLMQAQIQKATEPATTDDIREYEYYKRSAAPGQTLGFQEWMKQKRDMNGQTAQQITWGTDASGNYIPMQASRDGKLVASQMPPGVTPVPQEVLAFRKADAKERGEAIGKARTALPLVESNAKMMIDALDSLKNDKYLPQMTSFPRNWMPNVSEQANATQARIDQVQGKAFLQAFEGLRGGGAITEAEGAKATYAISRLQNLRVGTKEYENAIDDVKKEITALVELARKKASASEPNYSVRDGGNNTFTTPNGITIRKLD